MIGDISINYLAYADDICLTDGSEKELRENLHEFEKYCLEKKLVINTVKTKIMIIHKGRLPRMTDFNLNDEKLEVVNNYKYLGIWMTSTINFSEHIKEITTKARSKVGYLWSMLNIGRLEFKTALKIFKCYVEPILTYGFEVWWHHLNVHNKSKINAVFLKFLKLWLGIPVASINSMVYFKTEKKTLTYELEKIYKKSMTSLKLPHLNVKAQQGEAKHFKCIICDFHTTNNDILKNHITSHHNIRDFKCILCNFSTDNNEQLENHITTVHKNINDDNGGFKWYACNYSTNELENLTKHITTVHYQNKIYT